MGCECVGVCSPVDKHLGCFQFGAPGSKTVMNVHLQVYVWTHDFSSLLSHLGVERLDIVVDVNLTF